VGQHSRSPGSCRALDELTMIWTPRVKYREKKNEGERRDNNRGATPSLQECMKNAGVLIGAGGNKHPSLSYRSYGRRPEAQGPSSIEISSKAAKKQNEANRTAWTPHDAWKLGFNRGRLTRSVLLDPARRGQSI